MNAAEMELSLSEYQKTLLLRALWKGVARLEPGTNENATMQTLLESVEKTVADYTKAGEIILAFATRYPIEIPPSLIFCMLLQNTPRLQINMGYAPDQSGRDKLLYYIGKAWGSEGWMREEGHGTRLFNWTKTVDGVNLILCGVEAIPEYRAPVPATAFPLAPGLRAGTAFE